MARSAEARKVLAALNTELEKSSMSRGETLDFTASEEAILALIGATIDRKAVLTREWGRCPDNVMLRVKLSAEIRLLEGSLARLLKQIKTDVPEAESKTTVKARRVARARWNQVGNAGA